MAVRYCLNVGMEGIGILMIECCPKFNMSILLKKFQFLHLVGDFLADEEIAQARDGYIVAGVEGDYFEFIQTHLQGCLASITVLLFSSEVKFSFCMFLFHISAW